ncbi:MAG: phosphotransferase family protein [Pseudomonadales bacterium]|nr:phosphotransferase family protein [Pseudomonadales bacterium]
MIDKDHPSETWIADLRTRFPCEAEVDWVLTRKLRNRAGAAYTPVKLDQLCAAVTDLLNAELHDAFEVKNPRWLSGGASKLQMAFELDWHQPGVGRTTTPLVLRMEPAASIVETSRLREFELIKAFEGIVPVPPVFWVDREGKYLPYPALIYGFAKGVTKPSTAASGVSGTGINFGVELRKTLSKQFVEQLAAIHTFDWSKAQLSSFSVPAKNSTEGVEWQINWWERVWTEDANEEVPLMRFAAKWMRANMPIIDHVSLLHGDYRSGNFLFTEENSQISAWLDWETGHLGDRHEDIAYSICKPWGHMAEDGKTFLVCGMMSEPEFYEAYEKASGLSVDKKRLNFYRILNAYKLNSIALATAYRAVAGGKTHQDIVLGCVMGASYLFMDDLRQTLEEVA